MPKRVPVDEVIRMAKQGYKDSDIIKTLRDAGYSPKEINDSFNQAKIKLDLAKTAGIEVEVPEAEAEAPAEEAPAEEAEAAEEAPAEEYAPSYAPAPTPQYAPQPEYAPAQQEYYQPQYAAAESQSAEAVEEIAEGIISEKWEEFKAKVGDIGELKAHFESRLNELNERVKRLEMSMDRLHASVLGKVEDYSRSVKSLSSEVEALEGTLGKVIQPLVSAAKQAVNAKPTVKKK
jgi:hypothetical protein